MPVEPKVNVEYKIEQRYLDKAAAVADRYHIIVGKDSDGEYMVTVLELPGIVATGPDRDACMRQAEGDVRVTVAMMLQHGDEPPAPAVAGRRSIQLNVRVNPQEKQMLENAAQKQGVASAAEFLRIHGLQEARATLAGVAPVVSGAGRAGTGTGTGTGMPAATAAPATAGADRA